MKIVLDEKNYYLFRIKGRVMWGLNHVVVQAPMGVAYKLSEYAYLGKPFFLKKTDKDCHHIYNE